MTKQSFPIPEGCKAVTVEQIGNQIITTFEPSQPKFKRGDVAISKMGSVCVVDEITGDYIYEIVGVTPRLIITFRSRIHFAEVDGLRHATPDEAQRLWDALAKEGKRWNPETMEVEEIKKERWRAKSGEMYYTLTSWFTAQLDVEDNEDGDNVRYTQGRYFQTEAQAQRAADRLKAELDKFWEEEVR